MSLIVTEKLMYAANQTRQQWQSYYREKSNWRLAFFVGLPFTPVEVDPVLTECSCSVVAATSMSDASSICVAVQENHKCLVDPLTQIHTQSLWLVHTHRWVQWFTWSGALPNTLLKLYSLRLGVVSCWLHGFTCTQLVAAGSWTSCLHCLNLENLFWSLWLLFKWLVSLAAV